MVRNIIFDYGKVLVNYDFDALFRRLFPDEDKSAAMSAFFNEPRHFQFSDRGFKTFEGAVEDFIRERPDLEAEMRLFCRHKPEGIFEEVPGMRGLLEKLKKRGLKFYGLTNWDTQVYVTLEQFGIFKLLDGMVISSEEHFVKPEPEIYRRLLEKYKLFPEECVMVDDREENVTGARAVGMEGIVFRDAVQFEEELEFILSRN